MTVSNRCVGKRLRMAEDSSPEVSQRLLKAAQGQAHCPVVATEKDG
jgi:hypothetical protein